MNPENGLKVYSWGFFFTSPLRGSDLQKSAFGGGRFIGSSLPWARSSTGGRSRLPPSRPGRRFTGRYRLPLGVLWLVLCAGLVGSKGRLFCDERLPVHTLSLGPLTVHVAVDPLRFSWMLGDELLLAQRYRRLDSALEYFAAGGWKSVGVVTRLERLEAPEVGVEAWRLHAAGPAGTRAILDLSWSEREGAARLSCRLEGEEATSWRHDIVSQPDERFVGVASTPLGGANPLLADDPPSVDDPPGSNLPNSTSGAEGLEVSTRPRRVLLSSRGYGIVLMGTLGSRGDVFFPDPDAVRLQVRTRTLEYRVVPGEPRRTMTLLQRLQRLRPLRSSRAKPFSYLHRGLAVFTSSAHARRVAAALEPGARVWAERLLNEREAADVPGIVPLCLDAAPESELWQANGHWRLHRDGLMVAPPVELDSPVRVHLPEGLWVYRSGNLRTTLHGRSGDGSDGVSERSESRKDGGRLLLQGPRTTEITVLPGAVAVFTRSQSDLDRDLERQLRDAAQADGPGGG